MALLDVTITKLQAQSVVPLLLMTALADPSYGRCSTR